MNKKADNKSGAEKEKNEAAKPLLDPAELAKAGNRNMEFAARAARAYFNGATKLNQGMVEFVNARVKKDMETARALVTSKTSRDVFNVQAHFFERTIRDYADEASKVLHMAADIARETMGPIEEQTDEILQAIDKQAAQNERKAAE